MGGSFPESDVARASLVQMNEMSRRAAVAGMSFGVLGGTGAVLGGEGGGGDGERPNSALRMMADAAGLLAPDDGGKLGGAGAGGVGMGVGMGLGMGGSGSGIEEQQPASANVNGSGSGNTDAGDTVTFGVNGTYQLPFDGGDTWVPGGPGGAGAGAVGGTGGTGGEEVGGLGDVVSHHHEGLRVFTMGHLMPKSAQDDGNGNWSFDPSSLGAMLPALGGPGGVGGGDVSYGGDGGGESAQANGVSVGFGVELSADPGSEVVTTTPSAAAPAAPAPATPAPSRPTTAQKLRVRRSTFVPGWAVPPRVLLVDDDEVNRRMSSKFLQVFGCTIDVAVDGVGAVERMNLEKYDLVLMVRSCGFLVCSLIFLCTVRAREADCDCA